MKAASINAETVDDYIRDFPREVREVLKALRRAIREVAPDAEESISYRIPTYRIGKSRWCISRRINTTSAYIRPPSGRWSRSPVSPPTGPGAGL
jgi:hypothetical protein